MSELYCLGLDEVIETNKDEKKVGDVISFKQEDEIITWHGKIVKIYYEQDRKNFRYVKSAFDVKVF